MEGILIDGELKQTGLGFTEAEACTIGDRSFIDLQW